MVDTKLEKFRNRWGKIEKLYNLVQALDKNNSYEDAFNGYYRNFLEFLQTEHEDMGGEVARLVPVGDVRDQLNFSQEYFSRYRVNSLNYGLNNLEDIINDLGDNLKKIAVNLIPIKDSDMDKADNLDRLINSYKDSVDTLKRNLRDINPEREKERYETQKKTIEEYEGFKSLIEDHKDLIKNIVEYKKLFSYVRGEEGKPNIPKVRELFFDFLDGLLEKYKGDKDKYDDNAPIIETVKYLSGNDNFLMKYYVNELLNTSEEKLNSVIKDADLKDYIKRTAGIIDVNKQTQFFNTVYAMSENKI